MNDKLWLARRAATVGLHVLAEKVRAPRHLDRLRDSLLS
jgi:hypothetical protein